MDINVFKTSILNYLAHFTMYDYIAYAWLIMTFFITILLSIILTRKSPLISIITFILSLVLLFVGPFKIKQFLDFYLRHSKSNVTLVKQLNFSDTLLVSGEIQNLSKIQFTNCSVQIDIIKYNNNYFKSIANKLKPLRKQTIFIDKPIDINQSKEFRVVFDGYTYQNDINVSVVSNCY